MFGSHVRRPGEDGDGQDLGATVWADYEMEHGWRQQWIAMHFGDELQINDFGYLARNSVNYLHWELRRRFADQPEDSRYASKDWRWRASSTWNDHGQRLNHQFRASRDSQLRDGGYEYAQVNVNSSGVDDRLTRGHGVLRLPSNFSAYFEYGRPRKGRWAWDVEAEVFAPCALGGAVSAFARDQRQGADRRDADPVAVGGLAEPVGAERLVEQGFDRGPVKRAFRGDQQHRGLRARQGQPVTRARPTFPGDQPANTRATRARRQDPRRRRSKARRPTG